MIDRFEWCYGVESIKYRVLRIARTYHCQIQTARWQTSQRKNSKTGSNRFSHRCPPSTRTVRRRSRLTKSPRPTKCRRPSRRLLNHRRPSRRRSTRHNTRRSTHSPRRHRSSSRRSRTRRRRSRSSSRRSRTRRSRTRRRRSRTRRRRHRSSSRTRRRRHRSSSRTRRRRSRTRRRRSSRRRSRGSSTLGCRCPRQFQVPIHRRIRIGRHRLRRRPRTGRLLPARCKLLPNWHRSMTPRTLPRRPSKAWRRSRSSRRSGCTTRW